MSDTVSTTAGRKRQILLIDDDPDVLAGLAALLDQLEWNVVTAASGREALMQFVASDPDVVLADVMLPDMSGTDVLEQIKAYSETTPVVMMSGVGTIDMAVRAMRLGAEHFISKPCDVDNLELVLEQSARTVETRRQLAALSRGQARTDRLLGNSEAVQQINDMIDRIAGAPSPVLLQGESGSGKGVVARLIHDRSPRKNAPYVDLNCAGLSKELLESELFGHERGAFTGAAVQKEGLFEIANGGTLFLDEIGELELPLQARLLKVLEEKRFRRLGGVRDIRVEVRLIAATNRDLAAEVAAQRFRHDLWFRLNVVTLQLPPLRDRREDIPLLAGVTIESLAPQLGLRPAKISERAMQKLIGYSWPGNVRELRNVLERALLVSGGGTIQAEHLLLQPGAEVPGASPAAASSAVPRNEWEVRPLDDMIDSYIRGAVEAVDGNMRKAAKLLGISPSTLYSRLKK